MTAFIGSALVIFGLSLEISAVYVGLRGWWTGALLRATCSGLLMGVGLGMIFGDVYVAF